MMDEMGADPEYEGTPVELQPVTTQDTVDAIARMARTTHLGDQSGTAAFLLGHAVGQFSAGLLNSGVPLEVVGELAEAYLERLLPPTFKPAG